MKFAATLIPLALSGLLALPAAAADAHWIKAKYGPFEAISDDGRKPAVQALSQFVQFSFALGTAMGQPDLKLEPPLRVIVYRNAQEMKAECPSLLQEGRDHLMACTVVSSSGAEGQLAPELIRELTRRLLAANFGNMPPNMEQALVTFFSTIQSNAVRVTWGTPPPSAERTRDWALIHRIITQPDLSVRARIYLHNLSAGMDRVLAARNAFGDQAATFDTDNDKYFAAGVFNSAPAPSRPLNPDRDVYSTALTSDEGELMRADLLGPGSPALYQSLLKEGKQTTEANEGLALLTLRSGDLKAAEPYIDGAMKGGSKNPVALTEFARAEKDPDRAIELLRQALTIDPKYAEAHWVFGEKVFDPARQLAEWKQAVNLAPRNYQWWEQYAKVNLEQGLYAEAGRAWVAAAQAAPNPELREKYLQARESIEQQRLDLEDGERRTIADAKTKELARLKDEARAELARAEARANANGLSKDEITKATPWADVNDTTIDGTLLRIDCAGAKRTLTVRDEAGKLITLLIADPKRFLVIGGDTSFSCGPQKPNMVTVSYKPAADLGKGISGAASGLEYK